MTDFRKTVETGVDPRLPCLVTNQIIFLMFSLGVVGVVC